MTVRVRVDRVVIEGSWTGPTAGLRSAIAAALRRKFAESGALDGPDGVPDHDRAVSLVAAAVTAALGAEKRS